MSEITFSQNLGILEAGSDYKGFLGRSNRTLDYFASVRLTIHFGTQIGNSRPIAPIIIAFRLTKIFFVQCLGIRKILLMTEANFPHNRFHSYLSWITCLTKTL